MPTEKPFTDEEIAARRRPNCPACDECRYIATIDELKAEISRLHQRLGKDQR